MFKINLQTLIRVEAASNILLTATKKLRVATSFELASAKQNKVYFVIV